MKNFFNKSMLDFVYRYAMKNNLPILNYVTLPRLGAFHAIIDELTPLPVTKYGSSKEDNSRYEDSGEYNVTQRMVTAII